jgi:hypothetical protein
VNLNIIAVWKSLSRDPVMTVAATSIKLRFLYTLHELLRELRGHSNRHPESITPEINQAEMSIPHDVQIFLDRYPGEEDDPASTANLDFYSNTLRCSPDNRRIDEIHKE